jgi:predicted RNA polymerase sigma factor
VIDEPVRRLDEGAQRALVPPVLAGLVRRDEDFDAAEDALQEALLEALRVWPEHPPRDPRAWLAAVATSEGRIVTLDRQDRGLWDTREIAEGVRVLQSALAVQRPGRYQVEAAIAALHDDAASSEETDWPQILAWYDDLVALTDDPVRQDPAAVLGRAVAVGHVLGAAAGLRETDRLREVLGERHRWHAVRGHLHELSGDLPAAATAYADAARRATDVAERDHLVRQAARARASIKP